MRVRVVDIARREINAKTDLAFEYQEIKTGRKVTSLRFVISHNKQADAPDALRDDPKLARLVSGLIAHGMTDLAARAIVQEREPELVEWALADLARRLKGQEKIDNPAGWLRSAIEEDWRPQRTLFAENEAQALEAAKIDDRRRRDLEAKILSIRKAYNAYEKSALKQYTELLDDGDRQTLERGFREHLAAAKIGPHIVKKFEGGSSWYTDPIIKAEAIGYLKAMRPDFFILPIAEFADQNGTPDFEAIERELKAPA